MDGPKAEAQSSGDDARRRLGLSSTAITVGLLAVMIALVVGGFAFVSHQQSRLAELRETTRQMRMARQAVMEADVAVLNALARPGERLDMTPYFDALLRVNRHGANHYPVHPVLEGASASSVEIIASLRSAWSDILEQADRGDIERARAIYVERRVQPKLAALVTAFFSELDVIEADYSSLQQSQHIATFAVVALEIVTGMLCILAFLTAARASARESRARAAAVTSANAAREQVTRLFQMTEMLQSAADHPDANAVLRSTAADLLPEFGGALYVFNNSRDRLALSTSWGLPSDADLADTIGLQQCWAMKRGKPHVNLPGSGKLSCDHHVGDRPMLEIPMIARGEILGLLQIFAPHDDAEARLASVRGLGAALADAMSLALANISLRDKLQSQALRDPLTGLYNRRYMEDTLQRVVRLAERERHEVSVIMIDLDHFKRLNDQHGHAKGDAVLRDAASAVLSQLRETDVACRYGGEELIVVLPNCGIDVAAQKAERIRIGVEALSEPNGAQVSASFGVASFPQTATAMRDLVANADAALYRAKQQGRNRVVRAEAPAARRPADDEALLDKEIEDAEAA